MILSQTPSIVAKLIKAITRNEYCHSSISLVRNLQAMYSFGRLHPYNPFWAGFVIESPSKGTMKRFGKAKIAVLEIAVSDEEFERVRLTIERMLAEQKKYRYNYIGLFKAGAKLKHRKRRYHYYCSEFVCDVLKKNRIYGAESLPEIVHPVNFLDLPYAVIYRGRLCDYPNRLKIVSEYDRLGRADETKVELEYFKSIGVRIIFLDIPTTQIDLSLMSDEMSKTVLACINDMLISFYDLMARTELQRKKKRQREGIEAKKARGDWNDYGRPRKMSKEQFAREYERVINKEIGSLALMRELELNKDTYFRYVREYKREHGS